MCVVGVVTVWCVVGGVWFQLCAICSGAWCGVVWCGVVACGDLVWGVLCVVQSVFNVRHRKCKLGIIITIFRHRVYSHASVTPSLILFCSLWLNSLGKSGLQGAMTH